MDKNDDAPLQDMAVTIANIESFINDSRKYEVWKHIHKVFVVFALILVVYGCFQIMEILKIMSNHIIIMKQQIYDNSGNNTLSLKNPTEC